MNMRAKSSVLKSLDEILAETATDENDDNNTDATQMVSDRSGFGNDDQSSPLDDAFDAHTVIRPLSSFPPPPKPVEQPKPIEAPKAAAPMEEKPKPRPAPPKVEAQMPIDIPRPPERPKETAMKPESRAISKPQAQPQPRAEAQAEPKKADDEDFKVKMIHQKKPVVQEPSPITALIERPPQTVTKNPFDEVAAPKQSPENFSIDDLTYDAQTSPGLSSNGIVIHETPASEEVTGVTHIRRMGARQMIRRVPLRLFIPVIVFIGIIGAWAMLRHSPTAETTSQFENEAQIPQRPAQAMGQQRIAPQRANPVQVQAPVQQPQQFAQPLETPPPMQQVPPTGDVLSSFDRAFTKTQDQSKYSTNRL